MHRKSILLVFVRPHFSERRPCAIVSAQCAPSGQAIGFDLSIFAKCVGREQESVSHMAEADASVGGLLSPHKMGFDCAVALNSRALKIRSRTGDLSWVHQNERRKPTKTLFSEYSSLVSVESFCR